MNCTKMNLHSIWAYAYAQILNWRAKNQSGPTQNEVLEIAWIVQKWICIPYEHMHMPKS